MSDFTNTEKDILNGDFLCIDSGVKKNVPTDLVIKNVKASLSETQGEKGQKGEKGATGRVGNVGQYGEYGLPGEFGQKGNKGRRGSRGDSGEKGRKGMGGILGQQGIKGRKGEKGEPGIFGIKGEHGNQGFQGKNGIKGDLGDKGNPGRLGDRGDVGDDATGTPPKGETGESGENAKYGFRGNRGEMGSVGDVGERGQRGARGNHATRVGKIDHALFGAKVVRDWYDLNIQDVSSIKFSELFDNETNKLKFKYLRVVLDIPQRNDIIQPDSDIIINLEIPGYVTKLRPIVTGHPPVVWTKSSSDFSTLFSDRTLNRVPCTISMEYNSNGREFSFFILTQNSGIISQNKVYINIKKMFGTNDI